MLVINWLTLLESLHFFAETSLEQAIQSLAVGKREVKWLSEGRNSLCFLGITVIVVYYLQKGPHMEISKGNFLISRLYSIVFLYASAGCSFYSRHRYFGLV